MNVRPSLAGEFFEKLKSEPNRSQYLCSFVSSSSPIVETEWLDFKGGERLSDNKAKEILSQALSGFANTQGGVIIFGLDCRKDGDPAVDRVSALSLVSQPESFASRLMELHHQANDPPVLGLEIIPILHHAQPDRGFVACFVPESPFRPHRAEYAGRQYFIRAGDDFIPPSVSLLRNLFFPTTSAELVIHTIGDKSRTHPAVTVFVTNAGRATARDVMIAISGSPWSRIFASDSWLEIQTVESRRTFLSHRPIHPGETSELFTFLHLEEWQSSFTMPPSFKLQLTFKVFGDNLPPTTTSVVYSDDSIVHKTKIICKMEHL